jgi:ASC-1-like (ASCH) protein
LEINYVKGYKIGNMEHQLKIRREYLVDILDGVKTFEVRKDDRGFKVGDVLVLNEWVLAEDLEGFGDYTGRRVKVRVTYVFYMRELGLESDYCVMGIVVL